MPIEKSVLDSLGTPLLAVTRQGEVLYGNAAAVRFWRTTAERLRGHSLSGLFQGEPRLPGALRLAISAEGSSTIDGVQLRIAEGEPPRVLRIQVDPMEDGGPQGAQALVAVMDETHREHLAAASQEMRLMASMGRMLKGLAHELQNPLGGIKGATQLLARRLEGAADQAEYPAVILKELERLERLIKNLLAYGEHPPLHRTRFNLHELLDEVLWFVSNSGAEVELRRDYDPSLPELLADRDRMHQVFLNLIRNAVQASPPRGRVSLRTGVSGPWHEDASLPHPARTYLRIAVEDQGPGIPEEDREQVFTPFFTTKRAGTGLGLPISQQIVRAHQGRLLYEPGMDQGSVFIVLLPLEE